MSTRTPNNDPLPDEEDDVEEAYDENADEDFNPDQVRAENEDDSSASSNEDEDAAAAAKAPKAGSKKRKADAIEELDSGDEATINSRKRGKRKKDDHVAKGPVPDEADDSGGEGGFVRTRAQRLAEKLERKRQRQTGAGDVTIDVEQIWAELVKAPVGRPPPPITIHPEAPDSTEVNGNEKTVRPRPDEDEQMITIKRRIEYAGEVTEVEEQVARGSKEAQRYLQEHPEADPDYKAPDIAKLGRPMKRPSMFEPNPAGLVKGVPPEKLRPRAPSRMDVLMAEKREEEERRKKAEKMTTVQKSALDWKGFVETEGIREELDEYGKSKMGYLAREEFLGRGDLVREEAARAARLKG